MTRKHGFFPLLVTVQPRYKHDRIVAWEVVVIHPDPSRPKKVTDFPSKSDAVHFAADYAAMHNLELQLPKVANNPYSPEGNPYVPPANSPGMPDEALDGPNNPHPVTLDMDTPMTTRPRQMPGGSNEEDQEQPPGTVARKVNMNVPIICMSCKREFEVAKVASNLRCVCGSTDLDLNVPVHQFLVTWATKDGEQGQSVIKAESELDAIRWIAINMPNVRSRSIWKVENRKQAMEGDPPWGTVDEFQPPLGLLPENDQFAVPFTDSEGEFTDPEDRGDVSDPARESPPYEARFEASRKVAYSTSDWRELERTFYELTGEHLTASSLSENMGRKVLDRTGSVAEAAKAAAHSIGRSVSLMDAMLAHDRSLSAAAGRKRAFWGKDEEKPPINISKELEEYDGDDFYESVVSGYLSQGKTQEEAEEAARADLRQRFQREDSGGNVMSKLKAIARAVSKDNPELDESTVWMIATMTLNEYPVVRGRKTSFRQEAALAPSLRTTFEGKDVWSNPTRAETPKRQYMWIEDRGDYWIEIGQSDTGNFQYFKHGVDRVIKPAEFEWEVVPARKTPFHFASKTAQVDPVYHCENCGLIGPDEAFPEGRCSLCGTPNPTQLSDEEAAEARSFDFNPSPLPPFGAKRKTAGYAYSQVGKAGGVTTLNFEGVGDEKTLRYILREDFGVSRPIAIHQDGPQLWQVDLPSDRVAKKARVRKTANDEFERILREASAAGWAALPPEEWFPVGGANVNIPATTAFARYIKATRFNAPRHVNEAEGGHWSKNEYRGGYDFYVWAGNQGLNQKEAFARAFSRVLKDNGIDNYVHTFID